MDFDADDSTVTVTWDEVERVLGAPHDGSPQADERMVAALLLDDAPAWVQRAEGSIDEVGWTLHRPRRGRPPVEDEPRSVQYRIRLTPSARDRYRAAEELDPEGRTPSDVCREALDEWADRVLLAESPAPDGPDVAT